MRLFERDCVKFFLEDCMILFTSAGAAIAPIRLTDDIEEFMAKRVRHKVK